jgi:hypothetical protein
MLRTYKQLLRAAQVYPSIKRASIIAEIKDAFRANRHETDPQKLSLMIEECEASLRLLSRFSNVKTEKNFVYNY